MTRLMPIPVLVLPFPVHPDPALGAEQEELPGGPGRKLRSGAGWPAGPVPGLWEEEPGGSRRRMGGNGPETVLGGATGGGDLEVGRKGQSPAVDSAWKEGPGPVENHPETCTWAASTMLSLPSAPSGEAILWRRPAWQFQQGCLPAAARILVKQPHSTGDRRGCPLRGVSEARSTRHT